MDALGKHMVCCASLVALGRKSQGPQARPEPCLGFR